MDTVPVPFSLFAFSPTSVPFSPSFSSTCLSPGGLAGSCSYLAPSLSYSVSRAVPVLISLPGPVTVTDPGESRTPTWRTIPGSVFHPACPMELLLEGFGGRTPKKRGGGITVTLISWSMTSASCCSQCTCAPRSCAADSH